MQTTAYEDIERGFERAGVTPCRFCAAGKYLSIHALLSETTNPSPDKIRDTLTGVWCRCTTYDRLIAGIRHAAELRRRRERRAV